MYAYRVPKISKMSLNTPVVSDRYRLILPISGLALWEASQQSVCRKGLAICNSSPQVSALLYTQNSFPNANVMTLLNEKLPPPPHTLILFLSLKHWQSHTLSLYYPLCPDNVAQKKKKTTTLFWEPSVDRKIQIIMLNRHYKTRRTN